MGKTRGLVLTILLTGLCLLAFLERGYCLPLHERTEGNGTINKDTGEQNPNGAMFWNGTQWAVNNTWSHKFLIDSFFGTRWKNYENPQTVTGISPTGTILNYGGYQVTRSIYSYSKPSLFGAGIYVYQAVEYVVHNTVNGNDIILRSNGTGNGTTPAYFDIYIDDETLDGFPQQVTAFRGDPVWFTYLGRASDAVKQTSPPLNRAGDLPSVTLPPTAPQHSNGYYLDINNGSDMGLAPPGKSYQFITQSLNNLITNLNSSYIVQFNLKWMDAQGNLQMISFFPSIASESFQAAPVATPVPTLSEWGMILFTLLVGFLAMGYLKKE
jgi:hypothetical protein